MSSSSRRIGFIHGVAGDGRRSCAFHGRWLPCRHVHSFPSSSLHSVLSDNGADNGDDANVFLLCVPLDDGCVRALAKTGLIVVMCLPTEQSPAHVGERERKERAFPLRFFAFPDGCFARERAWIGATYSWRKAHACAPCPLLIHFAYKVAARGNVHGQRTEKSQAGMVVCCV